MTLSPVLARPLQRRCAQCRRVQDVRLSALYHVVVPNRGGGTRRDGGYDCRFCGTANAVPANEMPQGLVASLPSHADQQAAAVAAKPLSEVAQEPTSTIAPAPPAETPVAAKPAAKRVAPPVWIVGKPALAALDAAFRRAKSAKNGFCTGFVRDADGAVSAIEVHDRIAGGDILGWLDRAACELLVIGGTDADGVRWKAVFHPLAGAATLAIDPADG